MDTRLPCGCAGLGLVRLCLAGAIALCLWTPPAAAKKVEGSDVTVLKENIKREADALKKAIKEAKEKKPSDPASKKAEDELDAAERTLLEAKEGSNAATKARKDVDAARKAADKAQDKAGEDASDYRSALRKIRLVRHRLLFSQRR